MNNIKPGIFKLGMLGLALTSLSSPVFASNTSTGQIQLSVGAQNVIAPIAPINFGTLTSTALAAAPQVGTTPLSVYTTAATAPNGGLSLEVSFDKFDKTTSKPYLWIGSATDVPTSPLFYDAVIFGCNGSATPINLTQGIGSQTLNVTLQGNILSTQCEAPTGTPGSLQITINQYNTSTYPPIVGGTYTGQIQMTVAPAGG